MAQIFMTFIGTGNYEPVTYTLGKQSFKNRFVSKSLLQMLTEQGKQFDRLIFFLTEQARKLNWEKYIRKGKDGKEVEDEGLLSFLEEHFPGKFTPVAIPDGNNEQEIMELFQKVYDSIDEGDALTVDTTHGFRSLPLLFFPVMRYAKELKHITIEHVFYGLFQYGQEIAPVVDLKLYDQILDYSGAAHLFIRSGNAEEMKKLIEDTSLEMDPSERITMSGAVNVVKNMQNLTTALLTCQGGNTKNRSIQPLVYTTLKNCPKLEKVTAPKSKLFMDLIRHAVDSIKPFETYSDPVAFSMYTVRWYLERGLIVQGYTALREAIITFLCCTYTPEENYLKRKFRSETLEKALGCCIRNGNETASLDKAMQCAAAVSKQDSKCACRIVKIVQHLDYQKLSFLETVRDRRNCMDHFGMREDNYTITAEELKEHIQKTEELFEDVRARQADILTDEQAQAKLDAFLLEKTASGLFVNFSNHPSVNWSEEQRKAALEICGGDTITDIPFPQVDGAATEDDITQLARQCVADILAQHPAAVMCMGETGVCFQVVSKLKESGICVVYSCSDRQAEEIVTENGTEKHSVFRFVQFREY